MNTKKRFKQAHRILRRALRECEADETLTWIAADLIVSVDRTVDDGWGLPVVAMFGEMAEALQPALERRLAAPWVDSLFLWYI